MVEDIVDPTTYYVFDLSEIEDHAPIIELIGLERNHNSAVVAMQIAALAIVIEQAMTVAEINFSSHQIHGGGAIGLEEVKGFSYRRRSHG